MKQILVTGGAGFIGSNAIAHLLGKYSDYTIINLDKMTYAASIEHMRSFFDFPQHVFIQGDICNLDLVENLFSRYQISDVIHFAAESHVDNSIHEPDIFVKTNILGTFNLLEIARKYWQGQYDSHRFHHISTDEVYGSLGSTGFFTENSPYAPNSPYSASKAASDHIVRSFHKTYGLNTVITHCSNNYGPHQHAEKLIPTIIRKAMANEMIPIYGNGQNVRDWIYVGDHCQAIDQVFHQAKAGDHFNIGGNMEMTNIELAQLICKELDQRCPRANGESYASLIQYVKDRLGHDFRYALATDKIQKEMGWQARTGLREGLAQTLDFYLRVKETA